MEIRLDWNDKKAIIFFAEKNGNEFISLITNNLKRFEKWKNDSDIAKALLSIHGYSLIFFGKKIRADRGLVLEAVRNSGWALEHTIPCHQDDKEIVLEAIKREPLALEYASDRLKDDMPLVLEAVKRYPHAIVKASERIKVFCKGKDPEKAIQSAILHEMLNYQLSDNAKVSKNQENRNALKI